MSNDYAFGVAPNAGLAPTRDVTFILGFKAHAILERGVMATLSCGGPGEVSTADDFAVLTVSTPAWAVLKRRSGGGHRYDRPSYFPAALPGVMTIICIESREWTTRSG